MLVGPPEEGDWVGLRTMYESLESRALGLPPVDPGRLTAWLATLRTDGWNLVARNGSAVVGHIALMPADDPRPKFVIFVEDDHQGRGIGTELITQAIAYAGERGHEALALDVDAGNRQALSVYSTVGFEVEEWGTHHEMRLPLEEAVVEAAQRPPTERALGF